MSREQFVGQNADRKLMTVNSDLGRDVPIFCNGTTAVK